MIGHSVIMLFLELYVWSTFSKNGSMSFNFFSSQWYNFMISSWKYWDTTSAGNDSEIFSNNNTQLKMHSHVFTFIVLLQFMHVTNLPPGTVATGLPHLSFVHAASTVRLVPTNSGKHIFGFKLIFISHF